MIKKIKTFFKKIIVKIEFFFAKQSYINTINNHYKNKINTTTDEFEKLWLIVEHTHILQEIEEGEHDNKIIDLYPIW